MIVTFSEVVGVTVAVAQHLAAGCPKVDDATYAARIATCEGCPEFETDRRRCKLCGCDMPTKASWAEQKCPLGKWPAIPAD